MTEGHVSFKVLPLLLLFCMNYPPITCQNCGLPRILRVSDQLTETLDTGQTILKPIPLRNVVNITAVKRNPGNFANIIFIPESAASPCAQLSLEVGTPLWQPPKPSLIDQTRSKEISILLEFQCSDGRHKEVEILFPIKDENTAMPEYESNCYELTTEPCTLDRCVLTFEKEIKIIDKDRDEENAGINLWTNVPHVINFLHGYSVLEKWYEENDDGLMAHKGYQLRAKLEYVPEGKMISSKRLNFTIFANNTISPANDYVVVAESTVIINFVENPHRMTPPVFTYPFYHAHVESRKEPVYTEPGNIYAYVPGQEHNRSDIEYVIEGEPSMFRIDGQGDLSFIKGIGAVGSFERSRVDYNVTAIRCRNTGEGMMQVNTTVPLIVFFHEGCEFNSTTLPPESTTPSDECKCASTPWPGITGTAPTSTTMSEQTSTYFSTTEHWHSTEIPTMSTANPTTESTKLTTTEESTTPAQSTPPPSECSCDCSEFSCENPQTEPSLNTTNYVFYPDPYECTKYHRCSTLDDGPVQVEHKFSCQSGTVFCPVMSACTTVEMCIERTYDYNLPFWIPKRGYGDGGYGGGEDGDGCQECQCMGPITPGHPENLCSVENYDSQIPDPKYCDVFHKCQVARIGTQASYIDYPMMCPVGLVYCPAKNSCGFIYDPDCSCESNKIFKQCDVCIMGKWRDFDIFNKTFI